MGQGVGGFGVEDGELWSPGEGSLEGRMGPGAAEAGPPGWFEDEESGQGLPEDSWRGEVGDDEFPLPPAPGPPLRCGADLFYPYIDF